MSTYSLTASYATYYNGPYLLFNNVWDTASLVNGTDFTQSITYNPATFPDGVTLSWSYPDYNGPDGVWAFPEIAYGDATDAGILIDNSSGPTPTQIGNLSLTGSYSVTLDANPSNYDVIFDGWLTIGPPNGTQSNIVQEISFVVWQPSDNFSGWDLLFTANGDNYMSRPGSNQIDIVPAGGEQLSGTVNFTQIFSELISHGVVSGNDYLSGMELGAEAWEGSGSLTINNLSYQWNAGPSVTSVSTSGSGIDANGNGDLGSGRVVTLILSLSEAVTVAGGTPTLTLNDGGMATYSGGSGSSALTFTYTVAAGQNTSDLTVTAVNLNAATITDGAGNAANLSGALSNPTGTLQIDTTTPTVTSVAASGSGITNGAGDLDAGKTVKLTLTMSEVVTVAGGTPTLMLNDGGTATYNGGSGTDALTFSYTVAAGDNTSDLAVTAVNLGTATVTDTAGNAANLVGAVTTFSGLQIDTTAPAAPVISTDTINGNNSVTLTGAAAANSTVTAYDGTTSLGTTTANGSGAWSFTTGTLASGSQTFTATATDAAGNTSPSSKSVDPTIGQITDGWEKAVTANWSTAADWSSGDPASSDLVALNAVGTATVTRIGRASTGKERSARAETTSSVVTYTITSTANETIAELNTVSSATLAISGSTFAITNGTGAGVQAGTISVANGATLEISGAFDNSGTIALNSTGPATDLMIAGSATLSGTGNVTLSNYAGNAIISNGAPATLTNIGNTISGTGTVGDGNLTLVNQGTIKANQTKALIINTAGNAITNSGTLEGTSSGGLDIKSNVNNSKTIEALGTNAKVVIQGVIADATTGVIAASGSGAQVDLDGATISGGTLETSGSNAFIETVSGSANTLDGGTISSGSTVEINSGTTLTLGGTVANLGTLLVNGGALDINGVLTGGTIQINGAGEAVMMQASTENVTFQSGSESQLVLDQATSYTGKISGFGTTQSVDLTDLNFAAGVHISYAPTSSADTSGVLTITEGANTAKLQMVGSYTLANFKIASDGHGGTLLTDPTVVTQNPGNAAATIGNDTVLDINTPDSGKVTFTGTTGTLWLAQPSTFTGKVSGFGANDVIDLPGVAFGAGTTLGYLPNSKGTGGTLTVTDGGLSAKIALLGNYMASSFVVESDNHGGTMVVEASQTSAQTLLTTSQHA